MLPKLLSREVIALVPYGSAVVVDVGGPLDGRRTLWWNSADDLPPALTVHGTNGDGTMV